MRDTLVRFLRTEADETALRRGIELDCGYDKALWRRLCAMGIPAVAVAEELGGVGGGARDIEAVCSELGRCLLPVPFIDSCVIASSLLSACRATAEAGRIVRDLAAGEALVAVGGVAPFVPLQDKRHSLVAGADQTLSGSVSLVMNAAAADYHLLGLRSDEGMRVVLVAKDKRVHCAPQCANDPLLRPSTITFDRAQYIELHGLEPSDLEHARLLGVAALAAMQAGAARAIFDVTVDYLKTRYQFGRAIGSFQAMKHMAADLLVEVESATSVAQAAAEALDLGAPEAARTTALAGFVCTDAFREVAAQAIQMHGGIAYTQEHVAHLYWRRSRAMLPMLGTSDNHRDAYLKSWESAA